MALFHISNTALGTEERNKSFSLFFVYIQQMPVAGLSAFGVALEDVGEVGVQEE